MCAACHLQMICSVPDSCFLIPQIDKKKGDVAPIELGHPHSSSDFTSHQQAAVAGPSSSANDATATTANDDVEVDNADVVSSKGYLGKFAEGLGFASPSTKQ